MTSLAEALPDEINRVRRIQDGYRALRGQPGVNVELPIAAMEHAITEGIVALGSGDVVRMFRAYHALQGWSE